MGEHQGGLKHLGWADEGDWGLRRRGMRDKGAMRRKNTGCEWGVNPQAEEKPAFDLYKLQHCSGSTEKTTYDDVPLPAEQQTHHTFNIQITLHSL